MKKQPLTRKRIEATIHAAFRLLMDVYKAGFEMGLKAGQDKTTTCSSFGRVSGKKPSEAERGSPSGRKK